MADKLGRRRDKLLCSLLVMLVLVQSASAMFKVEQGGLKIKMPQDAKTKYPNGFNMSLANFGSPKYGGEIVGTLIYVDKDYGEDFTCSPIPCKYGCEDFSAATPPFSLDGKTPYVMIVDRGPEEPGMKPCKFAQKVWNAQEAGAVGVIVVSYDDRPTTMEAPEDEDASYKYLKNITIPSAFITKSDGNALKGLIKPTKDNPHPQVMVSLDWQDLLPRQQQVEWEFWSNSNDMCGAVCDIQKEFIKEFVPVAKDFEQNHWTKFTPHYVVWMCPSSYHSSAECKSQCTNNGRYCTPDPDGDIKAGYSGADIVTENLRQLCVFRLANESGKPWLWWDYVTKFGEECTMETKKYNEQCAEQVFHDIGGETWSSMAKLRECIGDPNADSPNAILENEMNVQHGTSKVGEVYILPTIKINNAQYRGKLSYTEVLRALCSGFNKNNEPAACNSVGEDDCRAGAHGDTDCRARKDGKTVCRETFAGYECICGSGFISHIDPANGTEICLDINECLTTDLSSLEPACTCPRCACKNIYGGYECLKDLADECATNNGGCWQGEHYIHGKKKTFTACVDNIQHYKRVAAHGQPLDDVPLHTCQCPGCFEQKDTGGGKFECVPKCNLDFCDENAGVCTGTGESSGGVPVWGVVLTLLLGTLLVGGVGYGVYQFRIRSAMHQEIRAIMRQYMPLEAQGDPTSANGLPAGP